MVRGHGDPDGGGGLHLDTGDLVRPAHGLQRPLGELVDGELVGQSRQQDGEFVAPHPGHRVLPADRVDQALADLSDQVVAGGVAQTVVDRLEVVQVDEEHADGLADPPGTDQFLFDPVLEESPVGQSGQRVVPGQMRDPLEQLQVLEGGGGLVGQARKPFVEVGVPDGDRRRSLDEVGRDDPEELPPGEQRCHHRCRRARPLQERQEPVVVGGPVEDHHLAGSDQLVDERHAGADRHDVRVVGMADGGLTGRAGGSARTDRTNRSAVDRGEREPDGGRSPPVRGDGDQRPVGGGGALRPGPGGQLTAVAVPQVDRGLIAVGDRGHRVHQQLDQLGQGGDP